MTANFQPLIEYVPPKEDVIKSFAREVCEQMADYTDNLIFKETDVIRGLTAFFTLAVQVQAKHLNSQQPVDTNLECGLL